MTTSLPKDVSNSTLFAEYKKDVKAGLVKQAEERAEIQEENKRVDAIVADTEVFVPDCMVDDQIEEMMQEFEYRLMYQGMKMDDYLKYTGLTKEQVAADYKEQAARNVKIRLVLEAIIKAENITPDVEAVNKKIEEMANEQKKSVDEYKKTMDERYFNCLINQILSDALMAKLKELKSRQSCR